MKKLIVVLFVLSALLFARLWAQTHSRQSPFSEGERVRVLGTGVFNPVCGSMWNSIDDPKLCRESGPVNGIGVVTTHPDLNRFALNGMTRVCVSNTNDCGWYSPQALRLYEDEK